MAKSVATVEACAKEPVERPKLAQSLHHPITIYQNPTRAVGVGEQRGIAGHWVEPSNPVEFAGAASGPADLGFASGTPIKENDSVLEPIRDENAPVLQFANGRDLGEFRFNEGVRRKQLDGAILLTGSLSWVEQSN
jgi:hypothetical protein